MTAIFLLLFMAGVESTIVNYKLEFCHCIRIPNIFYVSIPIRYSTLHCMHTRASPYSIATGCSCCDLAIIIALDTSHMPYKKTSFMPLRDEAHDHLPSYYKYYRLAFLRGILPCSNPLCNTSALI